VLLVRTRPLQPVILDPGVLDSHEAGAKTEISLSQRSCALSDDQSCPICLAICLNIHQLGRANPGGRLAVRTRFNPAFTGGESSVVFAPSCGRKNHVCEPGGFRWKDILANEEFGRGKFVLNLRISGSELARFSPKT